MNYTKIRVLGDEMHLFSLKDDKEWQGNTSRAVLLLPSLTADFKISTDKENSDCYAAALSAAAFLIEKRGLPLSDILFETPHGNIQVFNTGKGEFSFTINKCKLLCANSAFVKGCDVEFFDVFVGSACRVIYTKDTELFSLDSLPSFVTVGERIPDAVVLLGEHKKYSAKESPVQNEGFSYKAEAYTEHARASLSTPLIYAAAAYSEYIRKGKREISFSDESRCSINYSSVTLYVKPKIII